MNLTVCNYCIGLHFRVIKMYVFAVNRNASII